MASHNNMTKLFSLFFFCVSLACVSLALPSSEYSILGHPSSSEEEVFQLFQQWQKEHGREYGNNNPEEKANRFQIFQRNLNYINEMNAKRKSPLQHRLGLNKFADMSPDEFKKSYLHDIQIPSNWDSRKLKDADNDNDCQNLPASVDWREKGAVTQIRDQGNCKSDWAMTVTGAIEGINKIVSGELVSLAPQQLVDCDPASKGCAGGFYFNAFGWVIDNGGIDTETNYPYKATTGTCKENANKAVTIDNLLVLDGSEEALLCQASKQPVSVSFDATGLQFYAGGVYSGENCAMDSRTTTLIALIVGYGSVDGEDYWIVKNSWGKDWGDEGYLYLRRNVSAEWPYGVCAVNALAGFPTKQASSSYWAS